jgi:hypothetical protein
LVPGRITKDVKEPERETDALSHIIEIKKPWNTGFTTYYVPSEKCSTLQTLPSLL